MQKIGITERGDAGIDLSWVDKLASVDFAIVITKNPIYREFQKALIDNKSKLICHVTCTGFGGSILEPNVPEPKKVLKAVRVLIKNGFPAEQIVLRVDPIIPTPKGINCAIDIIGFFHKYCPAVKRVRYSFIDMYPHVIERFKSAHIRLPFDGFQAPKAMRDNAVTQLNAIASAYNLKLESCAESNEHASGCISQLDAQILNKKLSAQLFKGQRKHCLCPAGKTELLTNAKRCPHNCVYCYWKG
jgi:hypothetical protein